MSVVQILVVDDFLPWQRFVRNILESETDLTIRGTANDGLEAIQKATELQPDVILMDIGLPKMNGLEVMRHIRSLSPASRILFLSQHRGRDLIQEAFQGGGQGYVLKSDASSDLLAGMRAVLRGQRFISRSLQDELAVED